MRSNRLLRLLVLLAGLLGPLPALAAPAFVQGAVKNCGTATSCALAYTVNVGAGDLLAACVRIGANPPTGLTVSDSLNGTWTQAIATAQTTDGHTGYIYFFPNTGAGANTLTVATSSSQSLRMVIMEFSGIAASPLDQIAGNMGTNNIAASGNTPVTTQASELVLGCETNANNLNDAVTNFNGYTNNETLSCASGNCVNEGDTNVAATGAQSISWTEFQATDWTADVATFKASGAVPPSCPKTLSLMGVGC